MPVPWLRVLDAVIGVTDLARSRRARSAADEPARGSRLPGPIETRVVRAVVGALKEVFDRDRRRLEFEAEQAEVERLRAERALRLELLRQQADREIARLRALAGIAFLTWVGSLVLAVRAGLAGRVVLGIGWLFLIGAIAASFTGQGTVADAAARERAPTSDAGVVSLWLMGVGFALVAVSVLL